jgi:hypothetical protein
MVCIDGWGDLSRLNSNGYRLSHSRHWQHDYAWWSAHLQQRGMSLGMYGNPLWVHVAPDDAERTIVGTDLPVASLLEPAEDARFPWVQVDRPGAEEYVKGWIHFYADMGVKLLPHRFPLLVRGRPGPLGGARRPRAPARTLRNRPALDARGRRRTRRAPQPRHAPPLCMTPPPRPASAT